MRYNADTARGTNGAHFAFFVQVSLFAHWGHNLETSGDRPQDHRESPRKSLVTHSSVGGLFVVSCLRESVSGSRMERFNQITAF